MAGGVVVTALPPPPADDQAAPDGLTDEQALTIAAEIVAAMTDPMDGAYSGDGGILWQSWVVPSGLCYDEISDFAEGVQTDEGKRAQFVIAARAMIAAARAVAVPAETRDDLAEPLRHWLRRHAEHGSASEQLGIGYEKAPLTYSDLRNVLAEYDDRGERLALVVDVQRTNQRVEESLRDQVRQLDAISADRDHLIEKVSALSVEKQALADAYIGTRDAMMQERSRAREAIGNRDSSINRLLGQVAAVRAIADDAMKLPTLEDPRPADDRVSPRAILAALGGFTDTPRGPTLAEPTEWQSPQSRIKVDAAGSETPAETGGTPQPLPRRDDHVAAWIKAARDRENADGTPWDLARWNVLDDLLEDYRLHADTGTPLDRHACEGPYCCTDEARLSAALELTTDITALIDRDSLHADRIALHVAPALAADLRTDRVAGLPVIVQPELAGHVWQLVDTTDTVPKDPT